MFPQIKPLVPEGGLRKNPTWNQRKNTAKGRILNCRLVVILRFFSPIATFENYKEKFNHGEKKEKNLRLARQRCRLA